jgi:hypothetical protein
VRDNPFTEEEDAVIRNHVRSRGLREWATLSDVLEGRNAKQIRERWYNHLDPAISPCPWTPGEDKILIEQHSKRGNRWAEIARLLPGRTGTAVKNRWLSALARKHRDALFVLDDAENRELWQGPWKDGQRASDWMPPFIPRTDKTG